jgi:hypothetical protein
MGLELIQPVTLFPSRPQPLSTVLGISFASLDGMFRSTAE